MADDPTDSEFDTQFKYLLKNNIDFTSRTIFLTGPINTKSVKETIKNLYVLEQLDEKAPITLIINSGGGDVEQAFALIDAIRTTTAHITGKATGICYSAAIPILTVCDLRLATKYCQFMHHAISTNMDHQKLQTIKIGLDASIKLNKQFNQIIAEHSNKPYSFWSSFKYEDYYFFAEDALELGLIDSIC